MCFELSQSVHCLYAKEALGRELLCQLGIPEEKPFICFHARDSAYLNSIFPERD